MYACMQDIYVCRYAYIRGCLYGMYVSSACMDQRYACMHAHTCTYVSWYTSCLMNWMFMNCCATHLFDRGERVQSMADVLSNGALGRRPTLPVSVSMTSEALNSAFYPGQRRERERREWLPWTAFHCLEKNILILFFLLCFNLQWMTWAWYKNQASERVVMEVRPSPAFTWIAAVKMTTVRPILYSLYV